MGYFSGTCVFPIIIHVVRSVVFFPVFHRRTLRFGKDAVIIETQLNIFVQFRFEEVKSG